MLSSIVNFTFTNSRYAVISQFVLIITSQLNSKTWKRQGFFLRDFLFYFILSFEKTQSKHKKRLETHLSFLQLSLIHIFETQTERSIKTKISFIQTIQ